MSDEVEKASAIGNHSSEPPQQPHLVERFDLALDNYRYYLDRIRTLRF